MKSYWKSWQFGCLSSWSLGWILDKKQQVSCFLLRWTCFFFPRTTKVPQKNKSSGRFVAETELRELREKESWTVERWGVNGGDENRGPFSEHFEKKVNQIFTILKEEGGRSEEHQKPKLGDIYIYKFIYIYINIDININTNINWNSWLQNWYRKMKPKSCVFLYFSRPRSAQGFFERNLSWFFQLLVPQRLQIMRFGCFQKKGWAP